MTEAFWYRNIMADVLTLTHLALIYDAFMWTWFDVIKHFGRVDVVCDDFSLIRSLDTEDYTR